MSITSANPNSVRFGLWPRALKRRKHQDVKPEPKALEILPTPVQDSVSLKMKEAQRTVETARRQALVNSTDVKIAVEAVADLGGGVTLNGLEMLQLLEEGSVVQDDGYQKFFGPNLYEDKESGFHQRELKEAEVKPIILKQLMPELQPAMQAGVQEVFDYLELADLIRFRSCPMTVPTEAGRKEISQAYLYELTDNGKTVLEELQKAAPSAAPPVETQQPEA